MRAKRKKAPTQLSVGGFFKLIPQRPTLPYSYPYSTIGPEELNFRVRNGNGCGLLGMTTGSLVVNQNTSNLKKLVIGVLLLFDIPIGSFKFFQ